MAPIVSRPPFTLRRLARGAIAQLGERVVRNDEVGGSIPPGSTTLRPSGYAWRSHELSEGRSVVPGEALLGVDGQDSLPRKPWRPFLHETRHAFPEVLGA